MTTPDPTAFFNLDTPHPDLRFEAVRLAMRRAFDELQQSTLDRRDLRDLAVGLRDKVTDYIQGAEADRADLRGQLKAAAARLNAAEQGAGRLRDIPDRVSALETAVAALTEQVAALATPAPEPTPAPTEEPL